MNGRVNRDVVNYMRKLRADPHTLLHPPLPTQLTTNDFVVATHNAWGLNTKMEDLIADHCLLCCDVLAINETGSLVNTSRCQTLPPFWQQASLLPAASHRL